jgi:predicted small secreted protein
MAKKNVTIEEVKKAKIQLEKDILKLVKGFESDNGVRISYINMERKRDEKTEAPVDVERGPIINVDANMELDLVY